MVTTAEAVSEEGPLDGEGVAASRDVKRSEN